MYRIISDGKENEDAVGVLKNDSKKEERLDFLLDQIRLREEEPASLRSFEAILDTGMV